MTKILQGMSFASLVDETIVEVSSGSTLTPKCGSYGAYTIRTKSGKQFVIWQSMGEVNLSQVIDRERAK